MSTEERLAKLEANVESLNQWQSRQNGALERLGRRMDQLFYLVIAALSGVVTQLVVVLAGR